MSTHPFNCDSMSTINGKLFSNSRLKVNSRSDYPNIKVLFHQHLLNFDYLPRTGYDRASVSWWFYILAWPSIAIGTCKYLFMAIFKSDRDLMISLSDPTVYMGNAGFWFLLVFFKWSVVSTIVRYIFYRSNYSIRLQHWIKPLTILEARYTHQDDHLQKVINWTHKGLKLLLFSGTFAAWGNYVSIIIGFPIDYLPATLINSIFTGFHGYIVSAWEINFACLLGFYLYYCGHRFSRLTQTFKSTDHRSVEHVNLDRINNLPSIAVNESLLLQFIDQVIKLCKEINQSDFFWCPVNNTIFMSTFISETLMLYLMFFANVSGPILAVVTFLGSLTIFYGQSINFIPGIYLQHKFDESVNQIRRSLHPSKSISPMVKIRSLIVLDYLVDRNIFIVYWCINVCSWSYFKIQAEVAMLLLLLLANSRKS